MKATEVDNSDLNLLAAAGLKALTDETARLGCEPQLTILAAILNAVALATDYHGGDIGIVREMLREAVEIGVSSIVQEAETVQ